MIGMSRRTADFSPLQHNHAATRRESSTPFLTTGHRSAMNGAVRLGWSERRGRYSSTASGFGSGSHWVRITPTNA